MDRNKKTRIMAAALVAAVMLGVTGCNKTGEKSVNDNSIDGVDNEGLSSKRFFDVGEHTITKSMYIAGNPVSWEAVKGYEIISVSGSFQKTINGEFLYTVTYRNTVPVEAMPTLFIDDMGFIYGSFGTPVEVAEKVK